MVRTALSLIIGAVFGGISVLLLVHSGVELERENGSSHIYASRIGIDSVAPGEPDQRPMAESVTVLGVFASLENQSESDLSGATRAALAFELRSQQRVALTRIAAAAVRVDPSSALTFADHIGDFDLAQVYRLAVLTEWGRLDPDGFLLFVEAASPSEIRYRSDIFQGVAETDPEGLLLAIDRFSPSLRANALSVGLSSIARKDALAAISYIEAIQNTTERDRYFRSTGRAYARQDPDAALVWARALQPPSIEALSGVMTGLATVDPIRAIDVLVEEITAAGRLDPSINVSEIVSSLPSQSGDDLARIADRLINIDESAVQSLYSSIMSYWSESDPEAAFDWATANLDRVSADTFGSIAAQLIGIDVDLAMQRIQSLPTELQTAGITSIARELAPTDIAAAVDWAVRFRGQPGYRDALHAIAQAKATAAGAIGIDARIELLADVVRREPLALQAALAPSVAAALAHQDPRRAADWAMALELDTEGVARRRASIGNVASIWASRDANSAERWARGLPAGADRDAALSVVARYVAADGSFDETIFDAFDSRADRQRALISIIRSLGRSNPDLGRDLIDRRVTDPALRQQAEDALVAGGTNAFSLGPGSFTLTN